MNLIKSPDRMDQLPEGAIIGWCDATAALDADAEVYRRFTRRAGGLWYECDAEGLVASGTAGETDDAIWQGDESCCTVVLRGPPPLDDDEIDALIGGD